MRIDDNAEALAMMNRALGSLEAKIREAYNKGYRDGVKEGVNQATQEIMEYTYGMLTAEKFGLQHKIKSMVAEDEPNCSEKPNNCEVKNYCDDCLYTDVCDSKEFFYACTSKATISKMEQVDKDTNVRSKYDCETCKYNDYLWYTTLCDACCRGNSHYEPKTESHHSGEVTEMVEPQPRMTEDDAFYIVFKDLTKDEGLFTGRYDAKHGSKQYMHGVSSVMEYIAYKVGEDCLDAFNEHFVNNLIESEEKAERGE